MIDLRTMKRDDIDGGLSLCRKNRWNQIARDWEILLQLGSNDCRAATIEHRIIGTVTTIRYHHFFSWIGMVLVDPEYQRQGIGMQLLQEAIGILKNEETIKLDATPAGREVYLKLNFEEEYHLSRMETIVTEDRLPISPARIIHKKDLPTLTAFDRHFFGADRKPLLEWLLEGASQYAFLIEEGSEIQGYCLGREDDYFSQIGPVIAANTAVAQDLVAAALRNCIARPVIIDVLNHNPQWVAFLSSMGFTRQRSFIRMYRGSNRYPGVPGNQYAIAGLEFG